LSFSFTCVIRRSAGHVAAAVRDGVDAPFVPQDGNGAARGGTCDLELLDQLALGGYPRIRPVLARADPPSQDLGYLPVRGKRRNRVNAVTALVRHIDNVSCIGLASCESIRMWTGRYKMA